jgi:hypothetical protein
VSRQAQGSGRLERAASKMKEQARQSKKEQGKKKQNKRTTL